MSAVKRPPTALIADDHGIVAEALRTMTAKLAKTIYVLHVIQKNATRGIATPQRELDLIKARLRWAEQHARRAAEE